MSPRHAPGSLLTCDPGETENTIYKGVSCVSFWRPMVFSAGHTVRPSLGRVFVDSEGFRGFTPRQECGSTFRDVPFVSGLFEVLAEKSRPWALNSMAGAGNLGSTGAPKRHPPWAQFPLRVARRGGESLREHRIGGRGAILFLAGSCESFKPLYSAWVKITVWNSIFGAIVRTNKNVAPGGWW